MKISHMLRQLGTGSKPKDGLKQIGQHPLPRSQRLRIIKWDHIGSPTGHPPHVGSSVDKNLPPTFQSDSEYYGKNEIWGKKLPRKVLTKMQRSSGQAACSLTTS